MSFLIDTDICSAFLKGKHSVWQKFVQHGGQLHVSAITVGELATWALRKNVASHRLQALLDLLQDMTLLNVTEEVGMKFGELRASLLDNGQATPDLDLIIAATALVHNLTLVTHNTQDYLFISELRHQDWLID